MDRKDLQSLARVRLREAKALAAAGQASGAYYLAGYAVECALKACIAKKTARYEFPDLRRVKDSYTHDLGELLRLTDLKDLLAQRAAIDVVFEQSWSTVREWNERSRYQVYSAAKALELIHAIENRKHGVFQWLVQYW